MFLVDVDDGLHKFEVVAGEGHGVVFVFVYVSERVQRMVLLWRSVVDGRARVEKF